LLSPIPILIGVLILWFTYIVFTRSKNPYGIPQSAINWPSVIAIPLFLYYKLSPFDSAWIRDLRKKHGDVFALPFIGTNHVVLSGEEAINWLYTAEKNDQLTRILPGASRLIFIVNKVQNRDNWKKNREVLSPILMQSETLNNFLPTMYKILDEHIPSLTSIENGSLRTSSFEIAWLFSVGQRGIKYKNTLRELYDTVSAGLKSLPVDLPGSGVRKAREAREKIVKILIELNASDPSTDSRSDNVLKVLHENASRNKNPLTQGFSVEYGLFGLLFAAVDTTTMALNALFWYLINNPDVIEKCKKEIREYPYPETVADFHKYTYLNKVVRESLRISNTGMVGRTAKEGLHFKNHYFPKDTEFLVYTGYDHQDVNDFHKFDPERTDDYKWEPFGTPSRNCLGKVFAQVQMKLVLIKLLKEYNLLPEIDKGAKYQGIMHGFKNARLRIVKKVN
jgi:cytochrome P450